MENYNDFERNPESEFKSTVLRIENHNLSHYKAWALLNSARTGLICGCGYCYCCKCLNELINRGYTESDIKFGNID